MRIYGYAMSGKELAELEARADADAQARQDQANGAALRRLVESGRPFDISRCLVAPEWEIEVGFSGERKGYTFAEAVERALG